MKGAMTPNPCWCCGQRCMFCWSWAPCEDRHWCAPCKYGGRLGGCLCGWRDGGPFAWIGHLAEDDRRQFFADLPAVTDRARAPFVKEWQETADILGNPGDLAALAAADEAIACGDVARDTQVIREALERHSQMLEQQGQILERRSELLGEILRRLPPAP
jgi:hypothetical protein